MLFAVESADDPVVPLLQRISREARTGGRGSSGLSGPGPANIETVVAGIATMRGQKIHNQLAAIERVRKVEVVIYEALRRVFVRVDDKRVAMDLLGRKLSCLWGRLCRGGLGEGHRSRNKCSGCNDERIFHSGWMVELMQGL